MSRLPIPFFESLAFLSCTTSDDDDSDEDACSITTQEPQPGYNNEATPVNTATSSSYPITRHQRQSKRRRTTAVEVQPTATSQPAEDEDVPPLFEYNGEMKTLDEVLEVKNWDVDKLLDRMTPRGKKVRYYLCKWQDTWEPQDMYFALKRKGYKVKVLKTRTKKNGKIFYKCQWEPLWEPEDKCSIPEVELEAFEKERAKKKKAKRRRRWCYCDVSWERSWL